MKRKKKSKKFYQKCKKSEVTGKEWKLKSNKKRKKKSLKRNSRIEHMVENDEKQQPDIG